MALSKNHIRTLQAIFGTPVARTLQWRRIEVLIIALGGIKTEGDGSRVKFELKDETIHLHRPHQKEAKPYQIRELREFLLKAGVTNEIYDI